MGRAAGAVAGTPGRHYAVDNVRKEPGYFFALPIRDEQQDWKVIGVAVVKSGIREVERRFKVVNLQGVGHFPMLEDPQTFNRVLARIVAEWVALEPQRNPLSPVPGTR